MNLCISSCLLRVSSCNKIFLSHLFFVLLIQQTLSQSNQKHYWEYPREYDYPRNIIHGTYDFDEWPGVDHTVVYKTNFPFNQSKYDNHKIDYDLSSFDADDHEGYLKTPEELKQKGFKDIAEYLEEKCKSKREIKALGIFAHPDDETILAGGLLTYLDKLNISTNLIIISNGAASNKTISDKEISKKKLSYNAFGVLPNGKILVKCDLLGVSRIIKLKEYAKEFLGVDTIEILRMNELIDSKMVTEFGEIAEMDYRFTYGPKTKFRELLLNRLKERVYSFQPDIIITHGKNGEYGHYLHIVVDLLVREAVSLCDFKEKITIFTSMPEYNYDDRITHFLDLETQNILKNKHSAIKSIPEIYMPGKDFDKPWDPVKYPQGVFMKDYGYSSLDAIPPRYEFFKIEKY